MTPERETAFDRVVAGWLRDVGPADLRQDVIEAALAAARETRQRGAVPRALLGSSAWPAGRVSGAMRPVRPMLRAGLVLAIVAALLAGTLLVGSRLLRAPAIDGVLEPLGSLPTALFAPQAARLGDGTVLVVGIDPARLALRATVIDPRTGAIVPVDATDLAPARQMASAVALTDGDALVVVQAFSSKDGSRGGGGAWRYHRATHRFAPTGRFADSSDSEIESYQFADYPVDRLPDGRIRWVAPAISPDRDVVYDPSTDVFEPAVAANVRNARPVDGQGLIGMPDGRILDVRGRDENGEAVPLRLVDPGALDPSAATTVAWPGYVSGRSYRGAPLSDGRILLFGSSLALFDPRTATVTDVDDPVPPHPFGSILSPPRGVDHCASLADGLVVLSHQETAGITLWLFDPVSIAWRQLGSVVLPSAPLCTVIGPDRVLVVTSMVDSTSSAPAEAWVLH